MMNIMKDHLSFGDLSDTTYSFVSILKVPKGEY